VRARRLIGDRGGLLRLLSLMSLTVVVLAGCSLFQQGGSSGPSQPPEPTPTPRTGPAETRTGIAYAGVSPTQKLDLYLPEDDGTKVFPIVVLIHGGGFFSGDSGEEADRAQFLTGHGFAVASLNYRLSGEAAFPAGVQDVKAAIRFIRANAPSWGIDQHKMAVWGESAGGYMSAMIGATGGRQTLFDDAALGNPHVSSQVAAVVSWFGPTDFATMDLQAKQAECDDAAQQHDQADSPESKWLGAALPTIADKVASASVITYVRTARTMPPFFLAHGKSDCTVPPGQSQQLRDALRDKGFDVSLTFVPDAAHSDPKITDEQTRPTLDFLRSALGMSEASN
jgi:acetyl esterase/lipase